MVGDIKLIAVALTLITFGPSGTFNSPLLLLDGRQGLISQVVHVSLH